MARQSELACRRFRSLSRDSVALCMSMRPQTPIGCCSNTSVLLVKATCMERACGRLPTWLRGTSLRKLAGAVERSGCGWSRSDVDQVCPALRHLQLELIRCLPVIGRRSHSTSWHARRSITKLSARLASELSVRMCSQTLRCHGNLAIRRRSWSVRTCCMKLRLHAQWADAWHAL